ncbi:hypothetical protein DB347_15480 [Opitutaceae bacterium EW11]|nr:hypothetical protein DB347_15480 [Opitutaceae bacterium EW11]
MHTEETREHPSAAEASPAACELAQLTRGMLAADEAAYRDFQAAYFGRLARYLLVVTRGDEQRMRDALQETFRRIAKHIRVFDDETVFWSWLTTVARTAELDERKKARRYVTLLTRFMQSKAPETEFASESFEDPLNESLERNLATLEPDARTLLQWKYFDRMPVKEIAARLKTTEASVESRLGRIRQKLKAALVADLKK